MQGSFPLLHPLSISVFNDDLRLVQQNQSMSGRALRRLPVLALAKHISSGIAFGGLSVSPRTQNGNEQLMNGHTQSARGADVELWLNGMECVIKEQATEHSRLL
jgi:hypothetical protein